MQGFWRSSTRLSLHRAGTWSNVQTLGMPALGQLPQAASVDQSLWQSQGDDKRSPESLVEWCQDQRNCIICGKGFVVGYFMCAWMGLSGARPAEVEWRPWSCETVRYCSLPSLLLLTGCSLLGFCVQLARTWQPSKWDERTTFPFWSFHFLALSLSCSFKAFFFFFKHFLPPFHSETLKISSYRWIKHDFSSHTHTHA